MFAYTLDVCQYSGRGLLVLVVVHSSYKHFELGFLKLLSYIPLIHMSCVHGGSQSHGAVQAGCPGCIHMLWLLLIDKVNSKKVVQAPWLCDGINMLLYI